jgi:hypothetical protein
MIVSHIFGILLHPKQEWERIRDADHSVFESFFPHTIILAAIPPIAGYIGTTRYGWNISVGEPIKLTPDSAMVIAVLYYFAMLVAVFTIGKTIHWMSRTYGANPTLGRSMSLAAYTATPLFLIGILEIYPVLWLNFIIGLPVLGYSVYLLYTGVPIVLGLSEEKGFLLSSAILAFGLISLVALLAVTAFLWGTGFEPVTI